MKVWDWARIELVTLGSAVKLVSVARQVTDCTSQPVEETGWSLALSEPKDRFGRDKAHLHVGL